MTELWCFWVPVKLQSLGFQAKCILQYSSEVTQSYITDRNSETQVDLFSFFWTSLYNYVFR